MPGLHKPGSALLTRSAPIRGSCNRLHVYGFRSFRENLFPVRTASRHVLQKQELLLQVVPLVLSSPVPPPRYRSPPKGRASQLLLPALARKNLSSEHRF